MHYNKNSQTENNKRVSNTVCHKGDGRVFCDKRQVRLVQSETCGKKDMQDPLRSGKENVVAYEDEGMRAALWIQ